MVGGNNNQPLRSRRGRRFNGAGRPRHMRRMSFNSDIKYFKPRGVPMIALEEVILLREEVEALRLKNIKELDQTKCAEQMNISQSTFQRILSSSYKKISEALIEGKAIKIID